MEKRIKAAAVSQKTMKYSRNVSLALHSANLTRRQYYHEAKKMKECYHNEIRQTELPLRKTRNHLSENQKTFIRNFGENFVGKEKYKSFQIAWTENFHSKPVSEPTFYRYTKSEKGKLLDELNDIKIGF